MDMEKVSSTEREQDWIQKYRAALDLPSGTESLVKAVCAPFRRVAGILRFGMHSILKKRAGTPQSAGVSKQPAEEGLVQTPTMPDRKPQSAQSNVVNQSAARKHPSRQRRSGEKAS
jgi:hypothetical protein